MKKLSYSLYLTVDSAELFTVVLLPEKTGKFPTVIYRTPYDDKYRDVTAEEICESLRETHIKWVKNGYAVVHQHCRGTGKSSGDCIPYIYEREDGLAMHDWVRKQEFYNGELYLYGRSYCASVHYVTAPFADDIKGAVLDAQDCERYNCNYRNGFYKSALHGNWYVGMYKKNSVPNKPYKRETYNMLPLIDFSKTVFGEAVEDFDEILLHPNREDEFWTTRNGGGEAHDAVKNANIPILFVSGFYDFYVGGMFKMWNGLEKETKSKCAFIIHPYGHTGFDASPVITFENGNIKEAFEDFEVKWVDYVRGKRAPLVETGKITYYKMFGNEWCTDEFDETHENLSFHLGEGERTYKYNPYVPANFKGGLSNNFGGSAYQDPPNSRYDILSFFTPEFEKDTFVKGKMQVNLCVKSDCEDTCFYVRISIVKEDGDFGLRDDINQISNFDEHYVPNNEIMMQFTFDEQAFVVHKGEKLRIDVSSSAFPHFVRHTNNKGLFALQSTAKVATNTVVCDKSQIQIPIKK